MKMGEVGEGHSKSRGGGEWEFKDGRRCEVCNDKRSRAQVRIRGLEEWEGARTMQRNAVMKCRNIA